MQRYGQICIVCYNVRLICLFMTKCDLISHKCVQADFLTCVQTDFLTNAIQTADGAVGPIYAKHRFTFSRNTADQHEWGTGEFLSYYFYN